MCAMGKGWLAALVENSIMFMPLCEGVLGCEALWDRKRFRIECVWRALRRRLLLQRLHPMPCRNILRLHRWRLPICFLCWKSRGLPRLSTYLIVCLPSPGLFDWHACSYSHKWTGSIRSYLYVSACFFYPNACVYFTKDSGCISAYVDGYAVSSAWT